MKLWLPMLSFWVTIIVVGFLAWLFFFMMIILMNGFTGADASWGIWLYLVWVICFTVLSGFLAVGTNIIVERRFEWNRLLVAFGATVIATGFGTVMAGIGIFIGLLAAEFARTGV